MLYNADHISVLRLPWQPSALNCYPGEALVRKGKAVGRLVSGNKSYSEALAKSFVKSMRPTLNSRTIESSTEKFVDKARDWHGEKCMREQ